MTGDKISTPQPLSNERAVTEILAATGLPLSGGCTVAAFAESLEEIAGEHYWLEFEPSQSGGFNAIADAPVTPAKLKDRLLRVQNAAQRVFAGTSPRPLSEKVVELLRRLGRDADGQPLNHRGITAADRAMRSALAFCLFRAANATERPPLGYRPGVADRPWGAQRLQEAMDALVGYVRSPERGSEQATAAARAIDRWAQWSIPRVDEHFATGMARHAGQAPLDATIINLAELYRRAFDKNPSLYQGTEVDANPWFRFLEAVLARILGQDNPPERTALEARCRRLIYAKRKIVF